MVIFAFVVFNCFSRQTKTRIAENNIESRECVAEIEKSPVYKELEVSTAGLKK